MGIQSKPKSSVRRIVKPSDIYLCGVENKAIQSPVIWSQFNAITIRITTKRVRQIEEETYKYLRSN